MQINSDGRSKRSAVILNFQISQDNVERCWGEMEISITFTWTDSLGVGEWKNFENWSIFAEVM